MRGGVRALGAMRGGASKEQKSQDANIKAAGILQNMAQVQKQLLSVTKNSKFGIVEI